MADCSKHYKIARGEAMESAASLDVMRLRKVLLVQALQKMESASSKASSRR